MGGELYLHIEVDIDKDAFIFKKVVQNNLLVEEKKKQTPIQQRNKQNLNQPYLINPVCLTKERLKIKSVLKQHLCCHLCCILAVISE